MREEIVIPCEFGEIHLEIVGFLKKNEYGMVTASIKGCNITTVEHGHDKKAAAKRAIKRLLEEENLI